ncbi:MAG: hypothetical protein V1735_00600 [Nanoarchaeota archaeon]
MGKMAEQSIGSSQKIKTAMGFRSYVNSRSLTPKRPTLGAALTMVLKQDFPGQDNPGLLRRFSGEDAPRLTRQAVIDLGMDPEYFEKRTGHPLPEEGNPALYQH